MNLLVTGGCGFIGSNFVRQRLFEPGSPLQRLVNLDALTYAGNPANLADLAADPRYVFAQGDIGDATLVARLLDEHAIDAVVNFAAESHVDRSIDSPEPFVQTNVVGTLRLLNAARLYWTQLPAARKGAFRFLHVSTDEVYGTLAPSDPAFTEETPYAPNSPYAASKAASDHLVRAYQHTYGLPTLTTNCSNNYGPYHFPEKLIPLVILNALEGKPLPVYGDGLQVRDWLYVEDHAAAIWLVLQRGRVGETYNIGGLNEQPNIEIVRAICRLLDRKSPRTDGKSYASQITHVTDRPGHDRRYAIDCTKLQCELGWAPRESFATGIEKTVDWYLARRDWAADITAKKYSRQRLGVGA
ncbi:dTDP-glucose 4,6-dehydratase [Opitutus terrae]|uniref:dTDP-glucose 4,6-dehydratase n=1 Tax=Opitutus terrae (strain DSM 11246 / JCM 15787 / PB90-1) TaxID=452637 RepID=B1ZZT2_OPITP|nr:dTDP-glucose 4,6-dehydratase [Opitutus terrae]ACB77268.1 dTDP-glucose 4,6-dehydratase [Opitutus terrae PB90-1]